MADAEPHWRALETADRLVTPYQGFDFLNLWQRHIGAAEGVTPFIVAGFNSTGEPLFVWPLGRRKRAGLQVVEFLGGKHANFNMALWRRDAVAMIGEIELRAVLAQLGGQADLMMLANQPMTWAGAGNPFARLPRQSSPSLGHSGALMPDFDALLAARTNGQTRKKMRKKERTLAGFGEVRFQQVTGEADIRAALAVFFEQKSTRMRALGLPDVFSAPDVRQFVEAATTASTADGDYVIELYSLTLDGVIIATMGGVVADGRFSAMFSSIVNGQYGTESPGEQLLNRLVRHCCERGLDTFDLGIGEAQYKGLFCPDGEPMFDSYWPLTPAGRRMALVFRATAALKRAIKQQPQLWSLIVKMRRMRARLSAKS
ncbi:MAG: GNAT family N-acetyltransferase [Pseudolabrys sp.]|nr:GNAT family N-acetyltransferase [Pseudolabrys sp.]